MRRMEGGNVDNNPIETSAARPFQDRSDRHMTVLINAAVIHGERDGLCRIRNVSPTGLSIETSMPLVVGEPVIVTLHSGLTLPCVVRWTDDHRAGMSCDLNPIDLIQNARNAGSDDPLAPALPRFSRAIAAEIVVLGFVHGCRMDSISTRDVILTSVPTHFEPGKFVSVGIRGLGEFPATVKVSESDGIFARFATPISFAALDAWLTAEPWNREQPLRRAHG